MQEQGGTLAIEDLRRLHKLLMKYTDVSQWPSWRRLVYERRQCLIRRDEPSYRSLI